MYYRIFSAKKMRFQDILNYKLIYILLIANIHALSPDPKLFNVWGPGLHPQDVIMPARYFFIQAVDSNNNSINHSLSSPLQVVIDGATAKKTPCRIWTNILDRKDGVYIVRYKVYEQCSYIKISIVYENEQVAQSPYIINQPIYPDNCYCPKLKLKELLKVWNSEKVPAQIKKDFNQFQTIDWDEMRPKIIKEFDKPQSVSLCHYIIKDNQIYRKCYGKYVGFNMFSDSILLSLARKAFLPDLEFFVNLGDWPLSSKNLPDKFPIFSWCGSKDTNDIVMPTYELTESSLENMGRVMLDMLSVQGNVKDVWEKREPKLFWRGRDSNRYRLDLIGLSKKYPELFNVSLTNFFFFKDEEDEYGPKSDHVSFFTFFDYKYQLSIDGTVAAYRMPFLLGGGSLVYKPHSRYYEHFYAGLIPSVHYIPVETNLSNLIEKIEWAKNNDAQSKIIAENGQKYANDQLLPQNVFLYYMHLLNELSKVMTSKVRLFNGMEQIHQKNDIICDCLTNDNDVKDEL
ncbi:protein O-glucosyltransferase 2-like [Sitophilus oryzae]|uniref:Protein O-glucosyltransferase 2-like n=1 Tax=Sitophilus oryzae TaxID=7048 RepID=A0A6J2XKG2_SITOR|nr:protein O-glucosyltransferase 2-like [Sitophilus oryzae]